MNSDTKSLFSILSVFYGGHLIRGILVGVIGMLLIEVLGVYLCAQLGAIPANADAKPPFIEKWLARKALHAAIDRTAPRTQNPVALNDANLLDGIKLYAADCAVCHGTADGEASHIARGLFQKAPQLARHGVEDDTEGETYWKLYHGIRLTGMPAFRETLSENEIWKITLFLKHMDSLPPMPKKAWQALAPQSAHSI